MMSVTGLIRARGGGNLLRQLPKQFNSCPNRYSMCSRTSLLAQSFPPIPIFGSKNYATTASSATDSKSTEWTTIYRLPLIRLAAGFQRLKIYQGLLTTLGLPISIGLAEFGHLSPSSVAIVGAIGGSGLLTLTLCSLIVRNIIGFIYINEERDKVKVAHIDFWGKRCDTVLDIDDLDVEWAKVRPTVFHLYQKIRLYSNQGQSFKLIQNHGIVVEPQIFARIFGE